MSLLSNKKWVPIGQAATILGVSIDTIRRWDKQKKLHSSRSNDNIRYFSVEELEKVKLSQPHGIAEVAQNLGLSESTLRRIEKKGVIKPKRDEAGKRAYTEKDIQKYLHSEYFLRQKAVEEKILEPLKTPQSEDVVAETKAVTDVHHPVAKHPRVSEEKLVEEIEDTKVLGAVVAENRTHIQKLLHFQKVFYTAGLFVVMNLILIVFVITIMFLLFPEDTAKFFGYQYRDTYAAGSQYLGSLASKDGKKQVLGMQYKPEDAQVSILGQLLKPFSKLSLAVVEQIDEEKHDKIVTKNKLQTVNDIFTVDDEGNIVPKYNIRFPDSSYIKISDTGIVENLNAQWVQGKVPGAEGGKVAIISKDGTIKNLILDSDNFAADSVSSLSVEDGSITGTDLAFNTVGTTNIINGTITAEKLSNDSILSQYIKDGEVKTDDLADGSVTSSKLADGGVSDGKLAQITAANKVAGSAVQLSATGGLTNNDGLSLLTSCTSGQILSWDGTAWGCTTAAAGNSGDITNVIAGDGLSGGGAAGDVTLNAYAQTGGGIEVSSNGISLARGCADTEILKWDAGTTSWICASDDSTAGGIGTIQENDVTAVSSAQTLDFLGSDFTISNSPVGEGNISIDYTNSGITRRGQNETITGGWTFSNATPLTFSNGAPTIAISNGGTLAFTDGSNTLLSLADAGTTGVLTVSGGLTVSAGSVNLPAGQIGNTELANSTITIAGDTGSSTTALGATRTIAGGAGLTTTDNGSGTLTVAAGAGNGITVNANDIAVNLTASGNTGSTSSNSGLEVGSGGLTLLKGCLDNELLKYTDAGGWACASDSNSGTLTAIGDVTSGAAFNGTQGNALQFEGSTADVNEITLTAADAGSDFTITLPALTGTVALLEGTQTFTGDKTYNGVTTLNGNITANDASADTILLGQNGATDDTVTIAGDVSLTDDQWSISSTGVATGLSGTNTSFVAGDVSCTGCLGTTEIAGLDISDDTNLTASTGLAFVGDDLTNTDRGSSQNIFKTIAVSGQSDVISDTNADTLTLVAGTNVTISSNASTDSITINATDTNTTYSAGNDLDLTGTTFDLESTIDTVSTINLSGTGTLNGLDAIDNTSESTIEAAIDTLSNLTAASSLTTVGTLTGGATGAGFTMNFGTSTLSGNVGGSNIDESSLAGLAPSNFTSANISQWTNNSGYMTAASVNTLTNKSGNISQWTNDANYLTGNQSISLTGAVTGSGTTSIATTLANDAVTTSKIQDDAVTFDKIGQNSCSDNQIIKWVGSSWTCGTDNTGASGSFVALNPASSDAATGTNPGLWINHAGTGALIRMQNGGGTPVDRFVVSNAGIITTGGYQGSVIADAYINDALTISAGGSVDSTALTGTIDNARISGLTTADFSSANISQWTNDAGYITDGNTGWDNSYGFITATSNDALTNKTGNISMWTNDAGYLSTVDISANTNLSASDGITLTGDALTNTDKGSSQNIFKTIAVSGQSNVVSDGNSDTLTLVAGTNVTITTDATGDSVTINATDTNTTYTAGTDLDLTGTTFSLETTLDSVDTINLSGTGTLNGLDAIDNTTESTIESSIDTLANLTSASNLATVGTLTGGSTGTGFTLNFTNSTLSGNITGSNIDESSLAGLAPANFTTANISQWTNNSGYITDGNTGWDNSYGYITASSSDALTNKTGNISMWTNDSGYMTASSANTLTNKTGNISQWTNDSNYLTSVGNTNLTNDTIDLDKVADTLTYDANLTFASSNSTNDYKMVLDNSSTGDIATLFQITTTGSGGTVGVGLDLSDVDIATAIAIGANDVTVGGATISSTEFALLDGKTTLVDIDDAVATAITGTGTLTAGSTGAGFTLNFGTSTLSGNIGGSNIDESSLAGLTTSNFSSANISQWTNNSGYLTTVDVSSNTNLTATNGITLTGDQLTLASTTGGAGLTYTTGVLAVGAGNGITANTDDIAINLTSSGTTGSTSSNSGLEVGSGGLTLLKGCTDNFILKYTDAGGWACSSDVDTNTTYTAGNDLDLNGSTFDLETTIDIVDTINLAGTGTLNGLDAIDNTTESTIESAIDTLSNLTSASSLVTVGTLTGGATGTGFTLNFTNSTLSGNITGTNIDESSLAGLGTSNFTSANISQWTNNSGYITASSSDALTNKTGNISMWTNNAGYLTSVANTNLTNDTIDLDKVADSLTMDANLTFLSSNSTSDFKMVLDNSSTGVIDSLFQITTTGSGGTITTALDLADADIVTALALGSNDVTVNGLTISAAEFGILDAGITLGEITDSGTFTAGTVDINGGAIDGTVIGANSAAAGTFTTLTVNSALAANGGITFDSGADTIGAFTAAGTINMNGNILTNIGATNSSFTTSGALELVLDGAAANGGLNIDNGAQTSSIFVAEDNNTAVFTIADGGAVTATQNINANGGLDVDDAFVIADGGNVTTTGSVGITSTTGTGLTLQKTDAGAMVSRMAYINFSPSSTGSTGNALEINAGANAEGRGLSITHAGTAAGSTALFVNQNGTNGNILQLQADNTDAVVVQNNGNMIVSGLGIEFTESDSNPACASNDYRIYADTSEGKLKKCQNGTSSDLTAIPDMNSFTDTTADTVVDAETTNYWDGAAPNITPRSANSEVLVMATVQFTGANTNDVRVVARTLRNTGAVACQTTGTAVGPAVNIDTTDNTPAGFTTSIVFVDAPATTSNLQYTLCSDSDTTFVTTLGGTINRIDYTLFEVNDAADLAEVYPTNDESLTAGEVVSFDPAMNAGVSRTQKAYDRNALGIISTKPALVIGGRDGEGISGKPVALSGRVPVKVKGTIKKGDMITSSDTPGVAMKATKAGPILGIAMADYAPQNNSEVGSVLLFVKTGYFNGSNLKDILADKNIDTNDSQAVLQHFVEEKESLEGEGVDLSEIVTDKVVAGLEIITPRLVADEIIARSIKADRIEGLEIYTNKLASLEQAVLGLKSFSSSPSGSLVAPSDIEEAIPSASEDSLELANLSVDGLATVSGKLTTDDLHVKNSLLVETMAHIADTMTSARLIVNDMATFFGKVVFKSDVDVAGKLTVGRDSAGIAVIKKGTEKVDVKFGSVYQEKPVVNASISFDDDQGALEESYLEGNIKFVITKRSATGFTIRLNSAATDDIKFSWTAVGSSNATGLDMISTPSASEENPTPTITTFTTPTAIPSEGLDITPTP